MPKHSALTGSNLHEPKGADIAEVGRIYVSDGAGGGSWQPGAGLRFGEMRITNNAQVQALTIATDVTLNTDSDYVKVDTGSWTAGPQAPCGEVSFDPNGHLNVVNAGLYEVSFWTSFKISVNSTLTAFKFSTNDSNLTLSPRKFMRLSGVAGDIGMVVASGFATLTANSEISVWAASNKSANLTMVEAGLTVTLLSAL